MWGAANTLKGMEAIIQDTIDYTSQRLLLQSIWTTKLFIIAWRTKEIEALRALIIILKNTLKKVLAKKVT